MKFSKALQYTLIFASVGILVTLLITYEQRHTLATYRQNLPFINLGDHVKNRSAQAHLWLEKLLDGDKSLNLESDVIKPFVSCQQLLQAAYDGKQTELGLFQKPESEETRALLKKALVDVEKLIAGARERWDANKQTTTATVATFSDSTSMVTAPVSHPAAEQDQKFDALYQTFQASMDRLVDHFHNIATNDVQLANTVSWAVSGVVFAGFVLLCGVIYRSQSRSEKRELENTRKLDEETKRVDTMSQFIEAVSAGNYDIELKSDSEEDNLTNMLVSMRDKLKRNTEDDRKRNWSTSGLAQIGEILRTATNKSSELYDNIVKFVVKYTKSNQGGLFILNENDESHKFIEMVACYAFERKKYLTRQVEIGSGLVGQCFLEGERIYLLEVPKEYINITSGLGGANPNALLIVPLKDNDRIYGVLELASFNRYEDYEIELVEKLAASIASTISNVRINDTTRNLLERTQEQTEQMKSQEEEIRQNMEELEATQEEMRRKQSLLEKELQESKQQEEAFRKQERKLMEERESALKEVAELRQMVEASKA